MLLEMVFAVVLLLAPEIPAEPDDLIGPPAPGLPADLFDLTRWPLQLLACSWEIMDPRETDYVLARLESFDADLRMLRQRRGDLAGAPLAADALRFPDRTTVNDYLLLNRDHHRHLDHRQAGEPARWCELSDALRETNALYQVWDTVRDARCEYHYITMRRHALKRLRETLGEEAYYAGRLPPYVPLWRFDRAESTPFPLPNRRIMPSLMYNR